LLETLAEMLRAVDKGVAVHEPKRAKTRLQSRIIWMTRFCSGTRIFV
jgi:hypothetical protein